MAYTVRRSSSWVARRLALAWSALRRAAASFAASVRSASRPGLRNRSIASSEHDRGEHQHPGEHAAEHGDHRVAPGPPPVSLHGADLAGPDRLVGQEPPQVLGHRLGRRVASRAFLFKALQADRFQVDRQPGLQAARRHRLNLAHQVERVQGAHAPKRRPACKHFIKDHAQGVDIGGRRDDPLPFGLLGGHVLGRAHEHAAQGFQVGA